jgi:hypoxanthine phosphoribosyltransferase
MALKIENKIYLSWDDVSQLVDELCEKIITEVPNIDSVFGLKRGGLIPAVMVSHKLGLPWSDVMLPNTLVIDDICDTGITLKNTVGVYTAVLHYKPHTSCYIPNIYAYKHTGDEWIIYPWERKDSEPIQDYLKNGKI